MNTENDIEQSANVLKHKLTRFLDRAAHDIFDLVCWITIVGVTRFLWVDTGKFVFALLYWILAATLFGYLAAQFLLRNRSRISMVGYPSATNPENLCQPRRAAKVFGPIIPSAPLVS